MSPSPWHPALFPAWAEGSGGLHVGPREAIAWVGENTGTWGAPGARVLEGPLAWLLGRWALGVC